MNTLLKWGMGKKEQILLDETYNDKIYRLTSGEENIIKCELVDSDIT